MNSDSKSGTLPILVGVAVVAGIAAATGWFVLHDRGLKPGDQRPASFHEVAEEVGLNWQMRFLSGEQGETFKINLYDHGCGLAVGDFDGDGFDDIFFCNQLGKCALFRNKGDGTFEDVTEKAGVGLGDRVCVGATWVDYDNDGKLDLYVTSTRGGNVLFKNMGNGTFKDVTEAAGLKFEGHSQSAVFFDYDNDGKLDLFLTNTAEWTTEQKTGSHFIGKGKEGGLGQVVHSKKEFNKLYRNKGDGTFEEMTEKAGLKGRGWAGDAVAFDYNGDGKMDLFVTSMFGRCQLYRNNGDGTFTDVALEVLGRTPFGGIGARVFDFNNDGRLDLFVVDMHSDMWTGADFKHQTLELANRFEHKKFRYLYGPLAETDPTLVEEEKQLGKEIDFKHEELLFGNALYRNDGKGKFTEVSDQAGMETFWPWGIATGDFDNDGWEDAFIPSGMGYPFYYWPNYLMMNQRDGSFLNRADDFGIEPPARGINLPQEINGADAVRSSRCAATADFTNSGRLDIVVNNFNDKPYFFRNQFPKKNYVEFRLTGAKSNRDAIGAVVRLYRGDQILTRQVLGSGGYLSQSSKTIHFGLGDKPDIDRAEITWPSGIKQTFTSVAANTRHDVREPEKDSSGTLPAPEKTK